MKKIVADLKPGDVFTPLGSDPSHACRVTDGPGKQTAAGRFVACVYLQNGAPVLQPARLRIEPVPPIEGVALWARDSIEAIARRTSGEDPDDGHAPGYYRVLADLIAWWKTDVESLGDWDTYAAAMTDAIERDYTARIEARRRQEVIDACTCVYRDDPDLVATTHVHDCPAAAILRERRAEADIEAARLYVSRDDDSRVYVSGVDLPHRLGPFGSCGEALRNPYVGPIVDRVRAIRDGRPDPVTGEPFTSAQRQYWIETGDVIDVADTFPVGEEA